MITLTPEQIEAFHRDGFIKVQQLVDIDIVNQMVTLTDQFMIDNIPPIEYEAQLGYPGAPPDKNATGGQTIRRFLRAMSRHPLFLDWATSPDVIHLLRPLLGPDIVMPLAHHNCIMVKDPRFSSDTGWHQDIRFWSFERPELVSTLLALNQSNTENGCLRFLPGTHRLTFRTDQLDENKFLRTDLPENEPLLATEIGIDMQPGDVIFFHCKTFHAASRNRSNVARKSVLFTYRPKDNPPIPDTRSASLPELLLPA
ncbi:MAG: phytanoyl-CoA hydroxylase [Candidatus Latescibacterota bacterium]|jgi:phytanoyl-CoA hydroxylase